jgi:hypothetical protein
MIHDAKVQVTCDGKFCRSNLEISPDVVYSNYSGKNGSYNTSDEAIEEKVVEQGWLVKDGKHFCDFCSTDEEEKA